MRCFYVHQLLLLLLLLSYFTVNTVGLEATRANSPKLYLIVYQQ